MKLNKFVLIGALSVATASMASAVSTFHVYMTGSTAYRGAIYNTFHDAGANGFFAKLGGAYVEESTYKGSSASGCTYMQFQGTDAGGNTYIVNCDWSGSEAGYLDVGTKASESFLADIGTGGVLVGDQHGTTPSGTQLYSAVVQLAMADNAVAFSRNPLYPVSQYFIGIVPFVFVSGAGAPAAINNVTDSQFRNCVGGVGNLNLWTGNHADAGTAVYVAGRDWDSGTRVNALGNTGYGINTPVDQYEIAAGPTYTEVGNQGQNGGGAVATEMEINEAGAGAYAIAYLGASDAISATGGNTTPGTAAATILPYNGILYPITLATVNLIQNGVYTFWGNEYLVEYSTEQNTGNPDDNVRVALAASVILGTHEDGYTTIPKSGMHVTRTGPTVDPD